MKGALDAYGLMLILAAGLASREVAWWLGPLVFVGGIAAVFAAITLWYRSKVLLAWARFELTCWRARRRP